MSTTSGPEALPIPQPTDAPDGPGAFLALVQQMQTGGAWVYPTVLALKAVAGKYINQLAAVNGDTPANNGSYVWNGTTWVQVPLLNTAGALVPPASVAGTGVSLVNVGQVSFASATSVSLNGVFTSQYDNYRIKGRFSQAASSNVPTMVLRAAGSDATGVNYDETLDFANTATPGSAIFLARANWQLSATVSATDIEFDLEITSPALSALTLMSGRVMEYAAGAAPLLNLFGGGHRLASAFDGFTIVSAAAMTGAIRVYGHSNG